MHKAIGIDLGTSNSAVAYVNSHDKAEIIRNKFGRTVTPSIICFDDATPVVGDDALKRLRTGGKKIAQLFKRYVADEYFLFSAYEREYTAVDLSAFILSYLKSQAEHFLKSPVTSAVITVPAYFTDPQRKAIMQAGKQAGLDVLTIIHEPTAAALGYGLQPEQEKQLVLVYDLGGGTFDISLISRSQTDFRVIGTDGSDRLGGTDWDERLFQYSVKQFEDDNALELTDEECRLLYPPVESAKHVLSIRQQTDITIQARGRTSTYTITRALFEELTRDLMEEVSMLSERLLRNVGVSWQDITAILPVGGASRMPVVRSYFQRISGKTPLSGHNPEEVVALGAALQAEREMKRLSPERDTESTKIIDAVAHSLGMIVESSDRLRYVNSILIQKNTPLPAMQTRSYQMRVRPDGKTQLEIFLTQGDSTDPRHCIYLGRYLFSSFPSLATQTVILEITFQYDRNGVAQIGAVEQTSQQPLTLTVESRPVGVPARFAGRPVDQLRQDDLTVYLALDLSGSMQGEPLEQAKLAARSFVERSNLATTAIGLLSFSNEVQVNLPATHDGQQLFQAIEQLSLGRTGFGNNGEPFEELYTALALRQGVRYAVMLTDGLWTRPEVAIQHAQRCHAAGIEVFAVGFGAANDEFLAHIASSAKQGLLVELNQIIEAFSTIAQEIAETIEADAGLQETAQP